MVDLLRDAKNLFMEELEEAVITVRERWRLRVLDKLPAKPTTVTLPKRGEQGEVFSTTEQ